MRSESEKAADGRSLTPRAGDRFRRRDARLALVILCGLAATVALARWMDAHRPPATPAREAEELYVSPETARRMSLGFNGLIADWYWLRTLQYVGRKVGAYQGDIQLDDLSPLAIRQLAPLLDQATTLDPHFMAAYEYGAVVLPSIDVEAAIRLTRKGIAANPHEWRLPKYLGYIYWQQQRYADASAAYREGAQIPGAPAWMGAMAAQMELKGGSRDVARTLYQRMYEESSGDIKLLAAKRLAQIASLDERDAIRRVLDALRVRNGRCAANWREAAGPLRAAGLNVDDATLAPLDPAGVPYVLDPSACDVRLDARSPVPQK